MRSLLQRIEENSAAGQSLENILTGFLLRAQRQLLEEAGDIIERRKVQATLAAHDSTFRLALKVTGPGGVQYVGLDARPADRMATVIVQDENRAEMQKEKVSFSQLTAAAIVKVWQRAVG